MSTVRSNKAASAPPSRATSVSREISGRFAAKTASSVGKAVLNNTTETFSDSGAGGLGGPPSSSLLETTTLSSALRALVPSNPSEFAAAHVVVESSVSSTQPIVTKQVNSTDRAVTQNGLAESSHSGGGIELSVSAASELNSSQLTQFSEDAAHHAGASSSQASVLSSPPSSQQPVFNHLSQTQTSSSSSSQEPEKDRINLDCSSDEDEAHFDPDTRSQRGSDTESESELSGGENEHKMPSSPSPFSPDSVGAPVCDCRSSAVSCLYSFCGSFTSLFSHAGEVFCDKLRTASEAIGLINDDGVVAVPTSSIYSDDVERLLRDCGSSVGSSDAYGVKRSVTLFPVGRVVDSYLDTTLFAVAGRLDLLAGCKVRIVDSDRKQWEMLVTRVREATVDGNSVRYFRFIGDIATKHMFDSPLAGSAMFDHKVYMSASTNGPAATRSVCVTFPLNKLKAHVRIVDGTLVAEAKLSDLFLDKRTIHDSRTAFKKVGVSLEHQSGRVSGNDADSDACALMSLSRLIITAAKLPERDATPCHLATLATALRESGAEFLQKEDCMVDLITTMITSSVQRPPATLASSRVNTRAAVGIGRERAVRAQSGALFFIDRVGNRESIVLDSSSDSESELDEIDYDLVCRYVVREVLIALSAASVKLLEPRVREPVVSAKGRRPLSVRENDLRQSKLSGVCNGIGGLNDGRPASAELAASAFASLRSKDFSAHNTCSDFGLHVLGFLLSRARVMNVGRLKCWKNSIRMEFYGWQKHNPSLPTGMIAMLPGHFEAITNLDLKHFEVVLPQSSTSLCIESVESMWKSMLATQPHNVVGVIAVDAIKAASATTTTSRTNNASTMADVVKSGAAPARTASTQSPSGSSAATGSENALLDAETASQLSLLARDAAKARIRDEIHRLQSADPRRKFFARVALKELNKSRCNVEAIETALTCPVMCLRGAQCQQIASKACLRLHDCAVARSMSAENMQPIVKQIRMQHQSRLSAGRREPSSRTEPRPEEQSLRVITGPSQTSLAGSSDHVDAGKPTEQTQSVANAKQDSLSKQHKVSTNPQADASGHLSKKPTRSSAISTPARRKIVSDTFEAVTVEFRDDLPTNLRSLIKKHLHLAVQVAASSVASSFGAGAESESDSQLQKASSSTSGRKRDDRSRREQNRRKKTVQAAAVISQQEATQPDSSSNANTASAASDSSNGSVAAPAQLSSPIASPQQPQEVTVGGGTRSDKPHFQADPFAFRQAVSDGFLPSNGMHGYYSQNRRPMPQPFYYPVGFSPVDHLSAGAHGQMPFYPPPHYPSFYSSSH